ncbi:DUF4962 domain-containing protein [Paucibacter sp. B2R-40]|uniref:DUF4962 domain-containing protein n=1 Tax=Paucibacter sp. B2R-40 TaxID=2893554 RepID=UPI0021E3A540|nr:DUF4962 domain-containing protein [Paucibacter sp. B2R-40]MCV2357168.1 DUF4962 domain-containing protein [Paucibacter sp. B2R-40]
MKYLPQSLCNSTKTPRLTKLIGLFVAGALLNACGGGAGGENSADNKSVSAITPSGEASGATAAAQSASDSASAAVAVANAASAADSVASGPSAQAQAAKALDTNSKIATAPPAASAATATAPASAPATASKTTAASPTTSTSVPMATVAGQIGTVPPTAAPPAAATVANAAPKVSVAVPTLVLPSLPPLAAAPTPAPVLAPSVAPVTNSAVAALPKQPIATVLPKYIELYGTGISSVYSDGCVPSIKADFIDSATWTTRRLEPRDCAIVQTSTPVFSWRQPTTRDTKVAWIFRLNKPNGELVLTRQSSSPRLLLADQSLAPGQYTWTVSYTDNKKVLITSEARRFSVATGASNATLPSGLALANAAASKPHPRLVPTGSTPTKIAAAARASELGTSFSAFLTAADTALATPPTAAPVSAPRAALSVADAGALIAIKKQTEAEHAAIEALGYGFIFTGDLKYQKAGIDHVMALAAWSTTGPTSEAIQDQANRQIYLALAKGLDFFGAALTSQQTATIVATLKDRIQQARADVATLDANPYNSHVLTAAQLITEALLYAVGTTGFPEAKTWLAESWEVWLTGTIGIWGGSDGAYGNGEAYGWYTMANFANSVATARLIAGVDLSKWASVGKFGNSQIAFTNVPGPSRSSFGDDNERSSHFWDYSSDSYRLYASLTRDPVHEWYWRQNSASLAYRWAVTPANYMMLGLYPSRPAATAPSLNSSLFEDAGLVAIHSKAADPARSSVFFRSSRLGSFSHSHADNNSFNFSSKGLPLLISGGYYPYYGSPHHLTVARATRFKNALTFDGGIGQAEPSANPTAPGKPVDTMDARGQLINFTDTGTWAATTGDASLAYQGQNQTTAVWSPVLSNAIRSIAYNRSEKVLIIYDWATSTSNRTWELNFQSLTLPTVSGKTVKIVNGVASACIDVYGMAGNAPALFSGFPVAPENGAADQHRARYSAASPSKELAAVTVIREDCRAVPVTVNLTGTSAAVTINGGTAAVFDKKLVKLPL